MTNIEEFAKYIASEFEKISSPPLIIELDKKSYLNHWEFSMLRSEMKLLKLDLTGYFDSMEAQKLYVSKLAEEEPKKTRKKKTK